MNKFKWLILIYFISQNLWAQTDSTFKIDFNLEKVEVSNAAGEWKPAHKGHSYHPWNNFRTTSNHLIVLYENESYTIKCSKPSLIYGTYVYGFVQGGKVCKSKLSKFPDLGNYLKPLLAAHGEPLRPISAAAIKGDNSNQLLFPIDGEVLLNDEVEFTWFKDEKQPEVKFVLYKDTLNPQLIYSALTTDTSLILTSVDSIKFNPHEVYFWGIATSDRLNVFTVSDHQRHEQIFSAYQKLEPLKTTDPETYYYVKANFEIENKMYTTAYKTFINGRKENPSSELLKNSFNCYLTQLNLGY